MSVINEVKVAKWSDGEIAMFSALGFHDMLEHVEVAIVYRMAIEICFLSGRQDKATESLRRCGKAMFERKILRLSKEWDAMIEL